MGALDLLLSRKALAAGVGLTTRRNKVLPAAEIDPSIPARIGQGTPKRDTAVDVIEDRPFVFSLVGGLSGIIASRVKTTNSLRVIRTNLLVKNASYFVAAIKTGISTWLDTWRVDTVPATPSLKTFLIDGLVNAFFPATVPTYDRSIVPLTLPIPLTLPAVGYTYQTAVTGDATRSSLVIGFSSTSRRGVAALNLDGTEKSITNPPNLADYERRSTAGIYPTTDGTFLFIGGKLTLNTTSGAPSNVFSTWAKIKSTLATPWLTVLASGQDESNPYPGHMGLLFDFTVSPSVTDWYKSGSVGSVTASYGSTYHEGSDNPGVTTWLILFPDSSKKYAFTFYQWTGSDHYQKSTSVSTTRSWEAYNGSGLKMSVSSAVVGSASYKYFSGEEQWEYINPWPTSHQSNVCIPFHGSAQDGSSSIVTTNHVDVESLRRVLDIVATASTTRSGQTANVLTGSTELDFGNFYDYRVTYNNTDPQLPIDQAYYSGIEGSVRSNSGATKIIAAQNTTWIDQFNVDLVAQSVDYIFSDPGENIHLTMETRLDFSWNRRLTSTLEFGVGGIETDTSTTTLKTLVVKYVLSVRGAIFEFEQYNGSGFTDPKVYTYNVNTGAETTRDAAYHKAWEPTLLFSPPFMTQSNCPWIGYTTLAEEAAGAAHQIYVDISLLPTQYAALPTTDDDLYTGTVKFCPHQFLHIFTKYIQGQNPVTNAVPNNTNFWTTGIFPSASPKRIQFCNGQPGPWQSALGSMFSANQPAEITRI
jgi:hypothetical protein